MHRIVVGILACTVMLGLNVFSVVNAAEEVVTFERNDFTDMANWLCHPDKENDACVVDLTTTSVASDGTVSRIDEKSVQAPAVDCFYIYPTVSRDTDANSDMNPGPGEITTVAQQFARFQNICRPFAPMYRQMTILALQAWLQFGQLPTDVEMRYADISDAWNTYLRDHNNGRGVILIGHSQGSSMIRELLQKDVVGRPAEKLIVSALPIGITIPVDADTGMAAGLPVCTLSGQTGCLISYVSFRASAPPPAQSFFGEISDTGEKAVCVNPAMISGDAGNLDSRLSATGRDPLNQPVFADGADVKTPFVALPGLLSAECVESETHTYLSIELNANINDPRTDDIQGDLRFNGAILPEWGLHLVDLHLAMGNLIRIVEAQVEAWESN